MSGFAAVFTGQASQFPGMGKLLYESCHRAREVMDLAEEVLPGLRRLCFEGPARELVLTENTQPCVLAVDIAAFHALGRTPAIAAGHSLGEYAALVAAGSLSLETALQEAVPAGTGGMVALLRSSLQEARSLAASAERGVCDLANLNSPDQFVLSGSIEAMEEVIEKTGARRARLLSVSVPFHSSLLREAGETFARRLDQVDIEDPRFPIVSNVDAEVVASADRIRDALERQFAGAVLWSRSIETMLDAGQRSFIEFGPRATLSRMVTQTAKAMEIDVKSEVVSTPEDLARSRDAS
ncbi:MAG: ACP S-malonyltransferase [Planctomycetota bacterium]